MINTQLLKCRNPKCDAVTKVNSIPRTLSDGSKNPDFKDTAICSSCGSDIFIPDQEKPTDKSPHDEIETFIND